jgi:hypothetical protein
MTERLLARCAPLARLVGLAAVLSWSAAGAEAPTDPAVVVSGATEQATRWLAALDAGNYEAAWGDLASVMRQGRTLEDWQADIRGPREQLGKPLGREVQSAEFSTTVRGAPTGNYVTASYLSHFASAPPIVETVLLTFEDRRWRIGGYSVAMAPGLPPPPMAPDPAAAGAQPGG